MKHEMILVGPRLQVRRFILPGKPVRDGTLRCVACGQIDEIGYHNESICRAARKGTLDWDSIFSPPKPFVPIDDGARDGQRQLIRRGANYAVASWAGDMWAFPDNGGVIEQVDFEPTHYAPKDPRGV